MDRRRTFWSGGAVGELELVERGRVCALEVWCEALGGDMKGMRYLEAQEINDTIADMNGWRRAKKTIWCGVYGAQKGFERA